MATTQRLDASDHLLHPTPRSLIGAFPLAAATGALVLAVAVFAAVPWHAGRWVQVPFIGAFVEHTLVFNGVGQPGWSAYDAGLNEPARYHLRQIDGEFVSDARGWMAALVRHRPGDSVRLTYAIRGQPETTEAAAALRAFTVSEAAVYFGIPYAVGLSYLAIGLWVFRLRRHETAGRAFAVFCALVALGLGTLFDLYTTHAFTSLWTATLPLAGGALITLALVFPQELRLVRRRPAWRWIGFVPAGAVALVGQIRLNPPGDPFAYVAAWQAQYVFLGLCLLFFLAVMAFRRHTSSSPIVREQGRAILWGAVVSFSPLVVWLLSSPSRVIAFPPWAFLLPLALFPAAVAYSILRYRLLNTDYLIGQTLLYLILGALTTAGYALLVYGVGLLLPGRSAAGDPWLMGLYVFLLAVGLNPIRSRLQARIDDVFFRGSRAYRERLQDFSRQLTLAVDLDDILALLRSEIDAAIHPTLTHVFLFDFIGEAYAAFVARGGESTTDLRFPREGGLARLLAQERGALHLGPDVPLPSALQPERARLAVLRAVVFVPLPGKPEIAGWLALGPKRSGEPYTRDDLAFLASLSDQAALAVERARVITDLERRVKELDVLSRVSQAINFTASFDDLLELVYAQSAKLVEARHFRIVLRDPHADRLGYAFFLEDWERLAEEEKTSWPMGRGLASEVVRTGLPIVTRDYEAECRQRGVTPLARKYRAWLGVPLNAAAETLGAIVLASYEPGDAFTDEQAKVLQAIADQAATAIVKARLFEQAEGRARELATLNELSQSLASTLDLDSLLGHILHSATGLLATEAGSLFLADEDTGELVFRVTAGPVAKELIGTRLRPGVGFVGESVTSGQPVIVNDVQSDPRWFQGPDQETGFITHALMVMPLVIKERIIGALEVINKRDRTPFTDHDRSILAAFAGQAAVAIENARLYTLTDQALAARVDELSIMQRIDRELNVSLDVNKTMGITLDWAMRSTGAQAGLVGMAVHEGLKTIAWKGYADSVRSTLEAPIPLDRGIAGRVAQTGEAILIPDVSREPSYLPLRPSTRSQLTLPIRREKHTVGVLVLESDAPDSFTPDHLAFTARLVDHAAVALANALLYEEVRQANLAKSEFVSFVSHELKTPMTSIKGYADLLAQGAVGPVSEMQASFLHTIRGNVDRMASLVSDLADISRIEAGRLRLEFASLPFEAVVDDVVRTTQGLIEGKAQTLDVRLDPGLPRVWADQVRLVQILTNLVTNAHKYSPEKSRIVLRVEASDNRWDPDGAPRVLHVAVQDQGIGISPADQRNIFQKFFRADDRLARESPGTGLGLNITKNLVELQGGRIWFESEFRQGSTFHFTVPVAEEGG